MYRIQLKSTLALLLLGLLLTVLAITETYYKGVVEDNGNVVYEVVKV